MKVFEIFYFVQSAIPLWQSQNKNPFNWASVDYSGFHPNTYYSWFHLRLNLKCSWWSRGSCKLCLKQNSSLLRPLEVTLFLVYGKWYSHCLITSSIQDFPILRFDIDAMAIFVLVNLLFVITKSFQWKNILFSSIQFCARDAHDSQ